MEGIALILDLQKEMRALMRGENGTDGSGDGSGTKSEKTELTASDLDTLASVLRALETKVAMSRDILKTTRIGHDITALRKLLGDTVKAENAPQLAKECLGKCVQLTLDWKALAAASTSAKPAQLASLFATASKRPPSSTASGASSGPIPLEKTGNPVRDGFRNMLLRSLQPSLAESGLSPPELARLVRDIETGAFDLHHGIPGDKYKNLVRSRCSNLGNAKNTLLRLSVLQGAIPIDRLLRMTAEDLANPERKEFISKAKDEIVNKKQAGEMAVNKSTSYRCGKCKKSETSFFEMQTRSADEPMTIFITCLICNNKWKI